MLEIFLITLWTLFLIVYVLINLWLLFVMAFLIFDAMFLYPLEQLGHHGTKLEKSNNKMLDLYAYNYGFKRKRYMKVFKESDEALRTRIMESSKGNRT